MLQVIGEFFGPITSFIIVLIGDAFDSQIPPLVISGTNADYTGDGASFLLFFFHLFRLFIYSFLVVGYGWRACFDTNVVCC